MARGLIGVCLLPRACSGPEAFLVAKISKRHAEISCDRVPTLAVRIGRAAGIFDRGVLDLHRWRNAINQ
jgi:hypothetical protein